MGAPPCGEAGLACLAPPNAVAASPPVARVAAGLGYPVCAAGARVPDRIGLSRRNPQMAQ